MSDFVLQVTTSSGQTLPVLGDAEGRVLVSGGAVGPAGPTGAAGPTGPDGPAGPQGERGFAQRPMFGYWARQPWTARTSAADNQWYSVCWSPEAGLFVAVAFTGTGNRVMTCL